ncbi:MAG: TVP38/TMEM64 family protein [Candidatus Omnitrophica bacterium]|nr:TVP38/TMEM64 family protein [Candidatus Omnitrophota bacterium]
MRKTRLAWWGKWSLVACVAAGAWIGLRAAGFDIGTFSPERIRTYILSFGIWAPAMYLAVYGQPLIPLPATVAMGLAGAAFGHTWGAFYAMAGALLRAVSQFFVARWLGRDAVEHLLRGHVAAVDQQLGENGFKAVFFIRLIPNVPFDFQNYGLGFSKVRPMPYMLGSVLGILPGCLAYVWLGESVINPRQIWKLALVLVAVTSLSMAASAWRKRKSAAGAAP